ncbi:hypothetical protein STENM223S_02786 [Streptomyces tendae]
MSTVSHPVSKNTASNPRGILARRPSSQTTEVGMTKMTRTVIDKTRDCMIL